MNRSPLRGIRVLDLSRLLPGAMCSLILAELGAEVVKLEDTGGGDYLRLIPPQREGIGGAFYALNRGKRSIAVDLKRPAGRELLLRLVSGYEVVIESFRPGVLDRLGLSYTALSAVNSRLVVCSITGYGQTGPLRDRAGHDIDFLAVSGALAAGGEAKGQPALPGVQLADLAGGALWAAIRVLAALHGGEGAHLDVSMTEGAMSFLLPWLGDAAFGGGALRRGEGRLNGGVAAYGCYRAADGGYLAVGALEPKFWSDLCRVLGVSSPPTDIVASPERQHELRVELERTIGGATRDEWSARLGAADACSEPVLEMEELASHPQHLARGMFYTLDDPRRGPVPMLRLPVDGQPSTIPAPSHGEHTDQVLTAAGFSVDELARLRADGVIR
jgi:alpha-methylacyl-CoA racemase